MKSNIRTIILSLSLLSGGLQASRADGNPLVHEGVVSAPIESVWDALTTKTGQESWMTAHSEIDLKLGGLMRTHYDPKGQIGDSGTIENTILCFEPKRMLSFRVSKPPDGFPFPKEVQAMWTVIYLDVEQPGKTRIRIVGLGFGGDEKSEKMRDFFDRGNAFTLNRLQERFAPKTHGK